MKLPSNKRFINLESRQIDDITVLKYIGKSKNKQSLYLCECVCGTRVSRSYSTLIGKGNHNCGCKKRLRFTAKMSRGWEHHAYQIANLIPNYFAVDVKDGKCTSSWKFYCNVCGEYFERSPNRLKRHPDVYPCSCRFLINEDIQSVEDEIGTACAAANIVFVGWVTDKYIGRTSTFVHVSCPVHKDVKTVSVSELINHQTGLLCCATRGFKTNREGYFYLTRWNTEDGWFLKFGITNNVKKRFKTQKSKTSVDGYLLLSVKFDVGALAKQLEDVFKENFKGGYVSKQLFPDGYTETFERLRFLEAVSLVTNFIEKAGHGTLQYY